MRESFDVADPRADREALLRLNIEYVQWIAAGMRETHAISLADLLGMPIPDYVAAALDKLCAFAPPVGVFYLVRRDGEVVGMGGLRPLREGVVEMKRVYVPPAGRGAGLGARIVERLIEDAKRFGYGRMMLDSGPFMTSAHRLYERMGFTDIPAYPEAEVPSAAHHSWRFMQRAL